MSQTDRQTDKPGLAKLKNTRSTWWAVTGYNDNIERLQQSSSYPAFVKAVHGGLEECPTTKNIHFQGAVQCHTQQRGAAILDWLIGCHIEPAVSKEAVRKYAMKSDTAVGDKTVLVNTIKYYTADEICLLIGSKVEQATIDETPDPKVWYKRSVNALLRQDTRLAGQLMNPSLRNFWCDTCWVWIDKSRENVIVDESDTDE